MLIAGSHRIQGFQRKSEARRPEINIRTAVKQALQNIRLRPKIVLAEAPEEEHVEHIDVVIIDHHRRICAMTKQKVRNSDPILWRVVL